MTTQLNGGLPGAGTGGTLLGGKSKPDKSHHHHYQFHHHHHRQNSSSCRFSPMSKIAFWCFCGVVLFVASFLLTSKSPSPSTFDRRRSSLLETPSWGDPTWEKKVRASARIRATNSAKGTGMSVLVTGAAGFVGYHAAAALRRRGDGVLGIDDFNSYYDVSLKRSRAALLARAGVFVVEGDVGDAQLLARLFDVVTFTHVLHLAAQAGVRHALVDPQSYVRSNVAAFVTLLEAASRADPQPAIVYASSSSVYGLNSMVPFSERDRTDRPASLYAATKKAGEEIAHVYNHIHGLSLTALRFFTVYGPWGRPDMAYFFFTRDILAGKPITVYEGASGHPAVARDFTYVDDIVNGCAAALDTAGPSTRSLGEKKGPAQLRMYNLGNTSPVPVSELVTILERLLKVQAVRKVVKMPRNGDVPFTHANISLAQRELGYRPTTDLQTGLKKFVRWYLDYYGVNDTNVKKQGGGSAGGKSLSRRR